MRKSSFVVGLAEAFSLVLFAGSIIVNAKRDHSTVGSPTVQAIIYLIFAFLIVVFSYGKLRGKMWARTPYILFQIFGFVIAYTLASGTGTEAKLAGAYVAVLAFAGVYSAWRD